MGSRSENNSPNHENSNKTGEENRGVLRKRKTTLNRRNSAPNLNFLSQTPTNSTANRTRSVHNWMFSVIIIVLSSNSD